MSLSFSKIGFWRLIAAGIAVELVRLTLRGRWPDLSPHYHGTRGVHAKAFMISEYILSMAILLAAVGTIATLLEKRNFRSSILVACVCILYFSTFLWILVRS